MIWYKLPCVGSDVPALIRLDEVLSVGPPVKTGAYYPSSGPVEMLSGVSMKNGVSFEVTPIEAAKLEAAIAAEWGTSFESREVHASNCKSRSGLDDCSCGAVCGARARTTAGTERTCEMPRAHAGACWLLWSER